MSQTSLRWRRFGAATAAVLSLTAVVGCSGSSPTPKNTGAPPAQATAVPDEAATAAVAKALSVMKALRSYTFQSTQTLTGGPRAQVTTVNGRAVRPAAISYDLTVGGKVQQVIKVGGRTYLRLPPAAWKALTKPTATVDPLGSLLPLLTNLQQPRLSGNSLSGKVPAQVLSQARLAPAGAQPGAATPVTFTLDAAGHVTAITLRVTVQAGTRTLVLAGVTSFRHLDAAAAIKAPGSVKK